MSDKMTIKEVLRGTYVGKMQSVGIMQVIPLLSDHSDDRIGTPEDLLTSTSGYGSMGFRNRGEKPVIVPCHATYIVDQMAQNHAMSHVGYVAKKSKKTYDTACCVQQTQGGYISEGEHELQILPYSLRESALKVRKEPNYSKLWTAIQKFNKSLGLSSAGHLEYFFDNFKKQLDEFVAEFEVVEKQVGAIVLINGKVVGIERSPSYEYWESIFKALIRDCYGSKAIECSSEKITFSNIALNDRVGSISELMDNYQNVANQTEERTKEIVRNILGDEFKESKEENIGEFQSYTIENKQFSGQVVKDGKEVLYASLVTSAKFAKDEKWDSRKEFTI